MKKGILLGIAGLFILTGCGNKVVCTGKIDESGTKAEAKITATIKSDKVSKVSAKMTFADEKTAKTVCTYADLANTLAEKEEDKVKVTCKGKTVTFDDYTKLVDGEEKIVGMSKADFIKAMESQSGVKCK